MGIVDTIDMGTIKYTANGILSRALILKENKAQTINDGGLDLVNSTPFISTFRTTSSNEIVTLPYVSDGTYSGTIDWGDGTFVENTYANRNHTYSIAGDYDITITGECIGFSFNNIGDKLKILDIKQWGNGFIMLDDTNEFRGCVNLDITATDNLIIPPNKEFSGTFRDCSSLVFNNSINNWNWVNASSLSAIFFNSDSFNIDINSIDVSNVRILNNTFASSNYNQPLNNWNTINVVQIQRMFKQNSVFNQPLNNWNTSSVTTFRECFFSASSFNQDVSDWDFSGITASSGLDDFMRGKSDSNYNSSYYDNLLIKWAKDSSEGGLPVGILNEIGMGTIKYTSAGASARQSILDNNKAQTIIDGGQI